MKYKKCPKCGSTDLGDRWMKGRKLQQYCHGDECNWHAEPRTPEKIPITNTKVLQVHDFYGWDYITYDKYGHVSCYSKTFSTETVAMKDLTRRLECGEKNTDAGPYTGVLFKTPSSVILKGKMFRIKSGKISHSK